MICAAAAFVLGSANVRGNAKIDRRLQTTPAAKKELWLDTTFEQCVYLNYTEVASKGNATTMHLDATIVDGNPVLQYEGKNVDTYHGPAAKDLWSKSNPTGVNVTKFCETITQFGELFDDLPKVTHTINGSIEFGESDLPYCSQRLSFCREQAKQVRAS